MTDDISQLGRYRADSEVGRLRAENARLREALLTGVCMLSEIRVSSAEKCQLAYDHLSAALAEQKEK